MLYAKIASSHGVSVKGSIKFGPELKMETQY